MVRRDMANCFLTSHNIQNANLRVKHVLKVLKILGMLDLPDYTKAYLIWQLLSVLQEKSQQ